jgi:hypothetical protein
VIPAACINAVAGRAVPRHRQARSRAAGRCPAGAGRSRRTATGSAGW